jgi:hypothetical protein
MVTILAALVDPTLSLPKARVVGARVTGAKPVPVRLTVCGEFDAESVTEMLPVKAPVADGVNVASIVQVAPPASVEVQLLV